MSKDVYNYKRSALCAAKDLRYGKDILERIKASTDEAEIARIMATARNAK